MRWLIVQFSIVVVLYTYFVGYTALADKRKLSVEELVTQLDNIDPNLRADAANELAQKHVVSFSFDPEHKLLGDTETGVAPLSVVIEKLHKLTKDPFTGPAFAAHVALAKLGDNPKEHITFLCQQVGSSDSKTRLDAICAMWGFGSEASECLSSLLTALDDEDMEIKLAAAITLGEIGPAAKPAIGKLRVFLESLVSFDPTKPEMVHSCFIVNLAMAHIGVTPEVVAVAKKENDWLVKIRVLPATYKYGRKNIGMVKCLNMLRFLAAMTSSSDADTKAKIEEWFWWKIPMEPNTASIEYSDGNGVPIAWRGFLVTNINRETVLYTEFYSEVDKPQYPEITIFPDKPRTPVVDIRKIPTSDGKSMILGRVEIQPGLYGSEEQMIERSIKAAYEPLPADSDASMWGEDGMLVISLVFPTKGDAIPSTLTFLGDRIPLK
jgi:hypothetical protein